MDVQTESHTPLPLPTEAEICYAKAMMNNEPVFVLRAQDITAPVAVKFWAKVQLKLREFIDTGMSTGEAVRQVEKYYFLEEEGAYTDPKLDGAIVIAEAMENWAGNKKVAD